MAKKKEAAGGSVNMQDDKAVTRKQHFWFPGHPGIAFWATSAQDAQEKLEEYLKLNPSK